MLQVCKANSGGSACFCCNQIVFYGEAADSSKDVAAVTGRSVHICNCHSALGKVAGDPTWLLAQAARQKKQNKGLNRSLSVAQARQNKYLAIDSNAAWNIESGMLALSGGGGRGCPEDRAFAVRGSQVFVTVHSAFKTRRQPCPLHLPSLCVLCVSRGGGGRQTKCVCVSIHPAPHCDR